MATKNEDLLSFNYQVYIGGKEIPLATKECITSIEIKETVDGADSATINISDPEFLFIEDSIIVEDKKIKIKGNWANCTTQITFDGYISALDIDFGEDGIPKMVLTCMDHTHLANRKKKSKTWKNKTSADVVKAIAKSYGWKCVVESGYKFPKQESITQSDQSDADFLQSLAKDEIHPFTARLVGNTFYYVKKGNLGKSVMTLHYVEYPHQIVSLGLNINKERKQVEVDSSKTTAKNKKTTTTKAKVSTPTTKKTTDSKGTASTGKAPTTTEKKTRTYNSKTGKWS